MPAIVSPLALPDTFVGRTRELTELQRGLQAALGGHGRCVLLSGDPGIGKTRLLRQFAPLAVGAGAHVLWGRCTESGTPALGLWRQIVVAAQHSRIPALPPLGLVGALVASPPQRSAPPAVDSDQERFRLFDAVGMFLERTSRQRPIVLLCEDLHAADHDSLLLLRFLVRDLHEWRVLLVGTLRNAEVRASPKLAEHVDQVMREATAITLSGLAGPEVARLVHCLLAQARWTGDAPAALLQKIHEVTDGHPLFVESIVRLLAAHRGAGAGEDRDIRPAFRLPDHLRESLQRRLAPLSSATRYALRVAAILGRDFESDLLQAACGVAVTGAPCAALDEAVDAGILLRPLDGVRAYRFAHALLREALYEDWEPAKRAEVHHRIGEILRDAASTDESLIPAVAHHCTLALPAGYVPQAIEASVRAARYAERVFAYDDAVQHWTRALDAFAHGTAGVATPGWQREHQHCELFLGLGTALNGTANRRRAKEAFVQAAEVARRLGAADLLARAALGYGGDWLGFVEVATFDAPDRVFDETLTGMLTAALDGLGPAPTPLRARLQSRLAVEGYFSLPRETRERLTGDALCSVRQAGDPLALAHVLTDTCVALWGPDTVRERRRMAREVVRLGQTTRQAGVEAAGRLFHLAAVIEQGDTGRINTGSAALLRFAERTRQPALLWAVKLYAASRALLAGRFGEVEALAYAAFTAGQDAQRPAFLPYILQMIALRREQGRLAEFATSVPVWKALAEQHPEIPSIRTQLAFYYATVGQMTEARQHFDHLAEQGFGTLSRNLVWLVAMTELADVCAALDDSAQAAALYDLLLPYADHCAVGACVATCWGSVSRSLGILATLLGRWSDAERHFAVALERNQALEARPWVAYTQFARATLFMRRAAAERPGRSADLVAARRLLDAVLVTTRELQMTALDARATAACAELDEAAHCHTPPAAAQEALVQARGPRVFRQDGDFWVIGYAGTTGRLRHRRGFAYIAELLRHPDQEIHALDLVGRLRATGEYNGESEGMHAADTTGVMRAAPPAPLLDRQARNDYRRRIRELTTALQTAQESGTANDRLEQMQSELAFLTREFGRATGCGGRPRALSSDSERARVSVTRAIATAVRHLAAVNPALAEHLRATLKTGTFCQYATGRYPDTQWD